MEYYEYSGFGADALVVQGVVEFNESDRWAPSADAWYRYPYPYHPYAQWQLWHGEMEETERQVHRWSPLRAAFVAAVVGVAAVSAAP
jgi:hypothetical protein